MTMQLYLLFVLFGSFFVPRSECACLEKPTTVRKGITAQLDGYRVGWPSAFLNNEIASILLDEYGGYDVRYVKTSNESYEYNWDGMEDGTCDVSFEVWEDGREELIKSFIDRRAVSRIGSLGVIGRNGWFITKYAVDGYEPFASYRPFARCSDTIALDSENTTGTMGELGGTAPGWTSSVGALKVIENKGLCLEWINHPTIPDYLAIWDDRVRAVQPYLFTHWEPTQIFAKYKFVDSPDYLNYRLERVALPRWTKECQDNWETTYDCDYKSVVVAKYATQRNDLDPALRNFYEKFVMTNGDHEGLLGVLSYVPNATIYSTACAWVLANNETWKNWFWECESDCFGQGICEEGRCRCLTGFEGDLCETAIANEYFYCSNGSTFVDNIGHVVPPPLTGNPEFIRAELVCDEIIDCNNWKDEDSDCNPSVKIATIVFASLISFSILLVFISLIFLFYHRSRGRVCAAGFGFLAQLHIGVMWGMSSCFLFYGKASDAKCGMISWWIAIPSGLVIGSLVAKQYKVFRVLCHTGFQILKISNTMLLGITGGIIAVDVIVLIIWSAVDLPELGLKKVDGDHHAVCVANDPLPFFVILVVYKFILILVSAGLAWKSRKLPSVYSEAKHIGFALYVAVFLMILFIPIILTTDDQVFMSWILIQVGLWLWFFSIYLMVVGFILYGFFKDRNLPEEQKFLLPDYSKGGSTVTSNGPSDGSGGSGGSDSSGIIHSPRKTPR